MSFWQKHMVLRIFTGRTELFLVIYGTKQTGVCKNDKKTIEIAGVFVYNVRIVVVSTAFHERRMNTHVYCKRDS